MQSVFITGTDTGVGKTRVSSLIIRQLAAMGLRVGGMKPVASGAQRSDGNCRNQDALDLIAAANVDLPYEWVNPFCYQPAIAPHLAAEQAALPISIERILHAYARVSASADVVVVEGVGGWAVPIGDGLSMADVAAALGLPVVMVVGLRLGCLNHASLSAQAIQSSGIRLAGWVANCIDPDMPFRTQNIETLRSLINAPLLGEVPYLSAGSMRDAITFDLHALS